MQDRHREAGVIDVGVAGDEHDIDVVPAAVAHLLGRGRRERRRVPLVPHREREPASRSAVELGRGHGVASLRRISASPRDYSRFAGMFLPAETRAIRCRPITQPSSGDSPVEVDRIPRLEEQPPPRQRRRRIDRDARRRPAGHQLSPGRGFNVMKNYDSMMGGDRRGRVADSRRAPLLARPRRPHANLLPRQPPGEVGTDRRPGGAVHAAARDRIRRAEGDGDCNSTSAARGSM